MRAYFSVGPFSVRFRSILGPFSEDKTLFQRLPVPLDVRTMLDRILSLRTHRAVLEGDLLSVVDTHAFAGPVPLYAVEKQIMYRQRLQTGDVHRSR